MSSKLPPLKPQEIPLDHPESINMFLPSSEKPFVATPDAIDMYRHGIILKCLAVLQQKSIDYDGLDYLQIFEGEKQGKPENLWFIEDNSGGAITALLPTNY